MEVHRVICKCYAWVVIQQSNSAEYSHGADFLTLSEYRINKHLTGAQAQVIGHHRCESTNTRCILPGPKDKQQPLMLKYKRLMRFTGNKDCRDGMPTSMQTR